MLVWTKPIFLWITAIYFQRRTFHLSIYLSCPYVLILKIIIRNILYAFTGILYALWQFSTKNFTWTFILIYRIYECFWTFRVMLRCKEIPQFTLLSDISEDKYRIVFNRKIIGFRCNLNILFSKYYLWNTNHKENCFFLLHNG